MSATRRPLICAHRGASASLPDNSLEAFEAAIASGCELIETDLRRGPDGRIVLAHDEEEALREGVVELESLLELARGRIRLDLELKEPGLERDLVGRIGDDRDSIISSFHEAALRDLHELEPSLQTGLIVEAPLDADPTILAERAGAETLIVHDALLSRKLLEDAATGGRTVWVWTVNTELRLAELLSEPLLAAVITDAPARAVAIRASLDSRLEGVR
jgi:glycerophosphoryl diester phosphodiesterase